MKVLPSISASFIQQFSDWDACKYRTYLEYVEFKRHSPGEAQAMGHLFEATVFGEDGIVYEYMNQDGSPTAATQKAIKQGRAARQILKVMGIEIGRKQKRLEIDLPSGRKAKGFVDFLQGNEQHVIWDLKYSQTKESDKWSPFSWGDLENKDWTQMVHYAWLYWKIYGVVPKLFVFVQGAGGWRKIARVRLTRERLDLHERQVMDLDEQLSQMSPADWKPTEKHNVCLSCPHMLEGCLMANHVPEIQEVQLE